MAADNADVLAADNADVLAADTTDALAADNKEAPVPVSENIAFCVDETQKFESCADETSAERQVGIAKSADLLRILISAKSSLWEQSADPPDPGNQVSWTAGRPPLPHAPGARMTVVTQTPSNKAPKTPITI